MNFYGCVFVITTDGEEPTEDWVRFSRNAVSLKESYMEGRRAFGETYHWKQGPNLCYVTSRRYFKEVLVEHVMPFPGFIGENLISAHDNARPHTIAVMRHQKGPRFV
ncbi:hypothetical protein GQX74_008359 [Glossina fuscipes]|nr:hypothetical protein GQX74_008359 [Glossina fuscipes]